MVSRPSRRRRRMCRPPPPPLTTSVYLSAEKALCGGYRGRSDTWTDFVMICPERKAASATTSKCQLRLFRSGNSRGVLLALIASYIAFASKVELVVGSSAAACVTHSDCPGDQVCGIRNGGGGLAKQERQEGTLDEVRLGYCRCPAGHTLWKWRCYPLVTSLLSEPCQVSAQCRLRDDPNRHCNPLIKQCDCEFGFVAVRGECERAVSNVGTPREGWRRFPGITLTTSARVLTTAPTTMDLTSSSTGPPPSTEGAPFTPATRMSEAAANGNLPPRSRLADSVTSGGSGLDQLDPQQLTTIIYIGLAFFFVLTVGTVSAIYMRTVKEKRRNQAAIRGLLDIMTGGGGGDSSSMGSTNSAYDTNSVCTTVGAGGNNAADSLPQTDPAILALNLENRRQSRLLLTPMQEINTSGGGGNNGDVYCLPPPHLSAPVLPPIKKPSRVRRDDDEDIRYSIPRPRPCSGNAETGSSVSSIAAISRNLSLIEHQRQARQTRSAASFPRPGGGGEEQEAMRPVESPPQYNDIVDREEDQL